MEKIRNLSLRRTILLYITVSLVISFFLSVIIIRFAEKVQMNILISYDENAVQYIERESQRLGISVTIRGIDDHVMSAKDLFITESLCDFLESWTALLVPMLGSVIAMFLFYHNKIRKPLQILTAGSQMIARNELDFTLEYANKDELGTLCRQFEYMRKSLAENNRHMWKMVEQEKALRSAISHDIRSPLAVLKGYQEMLLEFIPQERLDKEKVLEILGAGMEQIDRMYDFVETMRRLSRLEDRSVEYMVTTLAALTAKISDAASVMAQEAGKKCEVIDSASNAASRKEEDKFCVDCFMVMEVGENLISNGLRFAKESVSVKLWVENGMLQLCVRDDGRGFEDDEETLTKAYYHSNPQDDRVHFGLGLYLCRMYCEKHGGRLLFANLREGGGEVRASFRIKKNP